MSNTGNKTGILVISLDFELMWGMFDKVNEATYGDNLRGVHTAIPKLLDLFSKYDIHATWATVGMLMYDNQFSLLAELPKEAERPHYTNTELSAYVHIEKNEQKINALSNLYFAPTLVKQITQTKGQELASHTFSHYYCLEEQTVKDEGSETPFVFDCVAFKKAAAHLDMKPTSIVFPRNQQNDAALAICAQHGITAYRGTESHFLYRPRPETEQTNLFIRGLRLLDHYINFSGHHTYSTITQTESGLKNIPASRFLRPYSRKLALLEPLRLRRIKRAMTYAAKHGRVFHLWWHPHNFGVHQKQNFRNLSILLHHYKHLQKMYGMESKNMREVATRSRE